MDVYHVRVLLTNPLLYHPEGWGLTKEKRPPGSILGNFYSWGSPLIQRFLKKEG
jgi:hypothetical protein